MKKLLLGAMLATAFAQAVASDYYIVMPVPGKASAQLAAIQVALGTSSLPTAPVGAAYSYNFAQLLQVTGDSNYSGAGVNWSVASGSLPPGVTLNASSGVLSGVPTASGNFPFTVKATYMTKSGQQAYQVAITNLTVTLAAATPPQALVGTAYSFDLTPLLTVTGDSHYTGAGVTWSVVSSTLPAGLYLTADGHIGGTPTVAGTGSVTARATYLNSKGEQTYQVVALNITVALATATAPQAMVGTAYSFDLTPLLTVTGDTSFNGAGVTWRVVSNTLPAGLYLTADGHIGGTPTAAGTGTVQVQATYRNSQGEQTYQVVAVDITVSLDADNKMPTIAAGAAYSYDFKPLFKASDSTSPSNVTWALAAGTLPGGLTLDPSSGILSGTAAPFSDTGATVTVNATYKSKSASQNYTVYPKDPYFANVVMLAHLDAEPFVNTKTGATLTEYGGATGQSTTKKFGAGAAYFSGGQAVVGPVFHPASDFTIEGWFYPTSNTTGNNTIVNAGGMDQYNWQPQAVYYNWPAAGQINWMASSTNNGTDISNGTKCAQPCNDYIAFGAPTLNAWNHFAVVYSSAAGQYMLYLNGVRTATVPTTKKPFQQTVVGTYLGGYPLKTASNLEALFHGYLDDFRLTDGVARYTGPTYIVPAFAYPSR